MVRRLAADHHADKMGDDELDFFAGIPEFPDKAVLRVKAELTSAWGAKSGVQSRSYRRFERSWRRIMSGCRWTVPSDESSSGI